MQEVKVYHGVTLSLLFLWKPESEVNHGLGEGIEEAKITQNWLPKRMGEKLENIPERQVLGGRGNSCGLLRQTQILWELFQLKNKLGIALCGWDAGSEKEKLSLYLIPRAAPVLAVGYIC